MAGHMGVVARVQEPTSAWEQATTSASAAAAPQPRAAAQPHPPRRAALGKLAQQDRRFTAVGLAMWLATALKIAPRVSLSSNLHTLLVGLAMLAVAILWPTLHPASYERRRLPVVACLRFALISLPINFDTSVFDALVPGPAVGRLGWVLNTSNMLHGTHVLPLIVPPLMLRLPLRWHMPLQAASVLTVAAFGVRTHCRTQLLRSEPVVRAVAWAHRAMASLADVALPPAAAAMPTGRCAQMAAALLFWWVLAGWLLPTLVLMLPDMAAQQQQQQQQQQREARSRPAGRRGLCGRSWVDAQLGCCCDALQSQLQGLLAFEPPADASSQLLRLPPAAVLCVRWFLLLLFLWVACCMAARLYTPPPGFA